jgi:hypothetical protein
MNSLLNNLGPRRSRGGSGGDIFISIGIIISLIVIFYMVYKLIQGNDSDDDNKNKEDDTALIPEIGPPVMGMVLKPDKDNTNTGSEEYEIGNGKLETYKIEYETGTDINVSLSKNVIFSVNWNNTIGFNTVKSITFTHYIKTFEDDAEYIAFKTTVVQKPTTLGDDVISNYFKNNSIGNKFTFYGTKGDFNNNGKDYSVLGYNRIGISIHYGRGQNTVAYGPQVSPKIDERVEFSNDEERSAKVKKEDLAATLEMVKEKVYTFEPEDTKNSSLSGEYIKSVYHVFPYVNSNFVNHLSSYLGTCNGTNNSTNNMVSLNIVDDGSSDTFKIQVFPGDFNEEITTNSDNNYLGFCGTGTDRTNVTGVVSKENALSFIMVEPPTDNITLPTNTPDDKNYENADNDELTFNTNFLSYKTFKVVDNGEDKFLVISNGSLKLKNWKDLTEEELPTMIMAFYVKNVKSCYANSVFHERKSDGTRPNEATRRHVNWRCGIIDHGGGTIDKVETESVCESNGNSYQSRCISRIDDGKENPFTGNCHYERKKSCEWRNATLFDI